MIAKSQGGLRTMNCRACPWHPGIKEHKSERALDALGRRERESFFATEKGNLVVIDFERGKRSLLVECKY